MREEGGAGPRHTGRDSREGDDSPGYEELIQSKCVCMWGGGEVSRVYMKRLGGIGVSERGWRVDYTLGDPTEVRQEP